MKISKTLLIPIFLMIGSCCCTIFEEEIAYLNNVAEVKSFIGSTEFVKNSSRNIKNCIDFLSTLPGKILEKSTYEPDFFSDSEIHRVVCRRFVVILTSKIIRKSESS